jgi:hypothetical protein
LKTGDTPTTAKSVQNPTIRQYLKIQEINARGQMGLPVAQLSDREKQWLTLADQLEAYLFLKHCGRRETDDMMADVRMRAWAMADEMGIDINGTLLGAKQ